MTTGVKVDLRGVFGFIALSYPSIKDSLKAMEDVFGFIAMS